MSGHRVTATEPCWVTQEYTLDGDMPEYVGDSAQIEEGIDMLDSESTYECECGAELNSWHDVMEHHREVSEE